MQQVNPRVILTAALPACREWPYEHIVPGIPKNDLPYNNGRQKGHKRDIAREERKARIEEAMAKMPQMIAEYRVGERRTEGGQGLGRCYCATGCTVVSCSVSHAFLAVAYGRLSVCG